MSEQNYPTPAWKSPPKTLSAALKRIETLQQSHRWASEEAINTREWGLRGWAEADRLGRLIDYRVKVGDPKAVCLHTNTETGRLSGNVYCSDCQDILVDNNAFAQSEGSKNG